LDDREDAVDEMYSVDNDNTFQQKKLFLDDNLNKKGVYNDNILPW